jgi:hypothetical protein
MEEKFDIFDSLKKTEKPTVPEGFFTSFSDKLSAKIGDIANVDGINKSQKAEVPAGFFDNFSDQLMEKINEQETTTEAPKTKTFSLRTFGIVAAVAACALLVFNLTPKDEAPNVVVDNTVDTEVFEETEDESIDEAYLAFLDEDEMIEFLIENDDIELGEDEEVADTEINEELYTDDDLYYLLGEDIEDYYLDEL